MRPTGSTLYSVCFILLLFGNTYAQVFPVQGKMFNGASVEVAFQGAINANYQLITGEVSTYKKDSKMGLVVEEMHKIGENKKTTPEARIDTTGIVPIAFPGTIDSVYFDQDKKEVVIVDTEGKKTSYPQKTDLKTKEAKPIQITDAAGNTVTVGKDGTVTKGATGEAGGAGGNTVASTDPQLNLLMKEILASFTNDIDDYLSKNPPLKKGPSADFFEEYFDKPDCLPDDADALRNIKAYCNELQNNSDQLDLFTKTILKKEENRTYFNDLLKKTLNDYKQKKSYKEALSAKQYKKVRETICPYLAEGGSNAKKYAEFQQIVRKGEECSEKLDSAYLQGMKNGIINRSKSTYKTLTSVEGWKNILSGGCVLLYNFARCGIQPVVSMSPECQQFYATLAGAGKNYVDGLLQEDCYKRGYAWGEMMVDALGVQGLAALAKGTIKIAGRLIKATDVKTKLAPVIKAVAEGGGDAAFAASGLGFISTLSNNLLKFGIKLGGKTLKTWSFITLLNIEIFRYSLTNGQFVFANALRTTAASAIVYTIRDIHYTTDVNPSIKFGTIEIVKDAAGKVAWRELVVEGAGRLLNAEGKFIDNLLETDYAKYLARKIAQGKPPRGRADWKEARDYWLFDSPMARGNAFNKKAVDNNWYNVNELNLANGKRLDSYVPPNNKNVGEIISRKATSLEDIEISTFETYLKEMQSKYAAGTTIRSNQYPLLDGQILQGKQILEIPSSNQNFSQVHDYINLAKNKYNIEIRFKPE